MNTSVQLNRQIVSDVSCIKSQNSRDSIWRHKIKYLLIQRWGVPARVPLNTATTAIHELLQDKANGMLGFQNYKQVSPEYINDLVEIKTSTYNFRAEKQAEGPRVNTTRYGLRSFNSEVARVWNSLPNELRVAESYPQFRRLIHSWDSPICGCPLCST